MRRATYKVRKWSTNCFRFVFGGKNAQEMSESMENTINSLKNPFLHFYFWIKSEMMDLEAMQQAILARNKMIEIRQKLVIKQRNDEQELSNLMQGKTTLKHLFKTKSGKDDRIQVLKSVIKIDAEDIINYQRIINIINQHLAEKSIPWFQKDKMVSKLFIIMSYKISAVFEFEFTLTLNIVKI